jgi:hypothetical protein
MMLVRYDADGSLDGTWGEGGTVLTGFPNLSRTPTNGAIGDDDEVNALTVQGNGQVLAAGFAGIVNGCIDLIRWRATAGSPQDHIPASPGCSTTDVGLTRYAGGIPVAPRTVVQSGPADGSATMATSAEFTFAGEPVGPSYTYQCALDGDKWATCKSPYTTSKSKPLAVGQHSFSVRATDQYGNVDPTPPAIGWTVCRPGPGCPFSPTTTILSGPPGLTGSTTATFKFITDFGVTSYGDGSEFECNLDGGGWASCPNPDTISGLEDGTHTLQVRAYDGDPSPPSWTWTVDTTPPDTTITSGPSGTVSSTTAAFTFSASEPGSSFQCRLESGGDWQPCASPASYVVGPGNHIFYVRAVDPAGNADPTPASQSWTYQAPAGGCSQSVSFPYVLAKGCFGKVGSKWVASGAVDLDGLTLTPNDAQTTITVVPSDDKIISSGPVTLSAGEVALASTTIDWHVSGGNGRDPITLGTLTPLPGASAHGLTFEGSMSVAFYPDESATVGGDVQLPFGQVLDALGVSATIGLRVTPSGGLDLGSLEVKKSDLNIGVLEIKNLDIKYNALTDEWGGAATIVLPVANNLTVGASLDFLHGQFHSFSGSVDNLNVPIVDGVFLERVAVQVQVNPLLLGGGIGIAFGPQVAGTSLVRVDSNFYYAWPAGANPGHFHIDGGVKIAGVKLGTGYFDYFTNGAIDFGGALTLGLPDTTATPSSQPLYVNLSLDGAVSHGHWDVDAKAGVQLQIPGVGIGIGAGAEIVLSDAGLIGCAHLTAGPFTWSPGASYTWATKHFELIGHSCSVAPFETLKLGGGAHDASAAGGQAISLAGGGTYLQLVGTTAQPKVTLGGPHGQSITVPASSTAPDYNSSFIVLQDPSTDTTYIGIRHSAGRWRITPEAGSSPIASIASAAMLPAPHVTARVTGRGRERTLTWHLLKIPGQRVVFWEQGRECSQIIGASTAASGQRRFAACDGLRGSRRIEAQVISYGVTRKQLVVAHYSAPGPARPAKPGHLTVSAVKGGAVRVSWRGPAGAYEWELQVSTGDGAHLTEIAHAGAHSRLVGDVVPITKATVRIAARSRDGITGPIATARFTAKPPTKKKHKQAKKPGKR